MCKLINIKHRHIYVIYVIYIFVYVNILKSYFNRNLGELFRGWFCGGVRGWVEFPSLSVNLLELC